MFCERLNLKRKGIEILRYMLPQRLKAYVKIYAAANSVWISLEHLKKKGFIPKVIVDIGAYVGDWAKHAKEIFPDSYILMIEAQPDKEECLKQVKASFPSSVDYKMCLLGAQNQDAVRFFQMGSGSSVFEEQSTIPRKILNLPIRTLDDVIIEKGLGAVSFLKLDVQGYEIEILKGAKDTLKNVEFILMEVAFLTYNKGAPLLYEVIKFMKDHGWVAYDVCSFIRYRDGTLLQVDIMFVREDSKWRTQNRNFI